MNETKSAQPPILRVEECCEGILQGCGAIAYLAHCIANGERTMAMLEHCAERPFGWNGEAAVKPVEAALRAVCEAMNQLGDYLNAIDGVSERDQEATTPAFHRVKELLGK